jgi:hypothetical protein
VDDLYPRRDLQCCRVRCSPPTPKNPTKTISASSHSTATVLQEHMELPTLSISEFTDSQPDGSSPTEKIPGAQSLPPLAAKHWKTVQDIFYGLSGRSRNLYLGVSSLMRAVTEVRTSARYGRDPALHSRLSALESDCAAISFALPSWMFSHSRQFHMDESTDEHRSRLDTLFVLYWYVQLFPS